MRYILLLVMLLVSTAGHASNWMSVGKNDNGDREYLVDASSIGVATPIRRAWVKTIIKQDKPFSMERLAFNCEQGTMRWEAYTLYSFESDDSDNYPTPWKPIPPDTTGSAVMKFVCSWKPK